MGPQESSSYSEKCHDPVDLVLGSSTTSLRKLQGDMEYEQNLEKWSTFLSEQHENAINELNEVGNIILFDSSGFSSQPIGITTHGAADFDNSEALNVIRKGNNVKGVVFTHTHPLSNQISRKTISEGELSGIRYLGESIHLPPSEPDLQGGRLLSKIAQVSYNIDVTEIVFDGTGMWVYRKLQESDYCLFPNVLDFQEQLESEKSSFYGDSYEEDSPLRDFLDSLSHATIYNWHKLISQNPTYSGVTLQSKKEDIWLYLRVIYRPDFIAHELHGESLRKVLQDETHYPGKEILRKQVRGFQLPTSLEFLQSGFSEKSASGKLKSEDFDEILLHYASLGAMVAYVPKSKMQDLPGETDPAVWFSYIGGNFFD